MRNRQWISLVAVCLAYGGMAPRGAAQGKSAVSQGLTTIPSSAGTAGLEGSFNSTPSTGAGTYTVPLALPPGRAGHQPSLQLTYSTRNGNGAVGSGWQLGGISVIARDVSRPPRYVDEDHWTGREDVWLFNGVRLVPVDPSEAADVDCAGIRGNCAPVPAMVAGWQQYRPAVGEPVRVFRSGNATRWLVQAPDGSQQEFGMLYDSRLVAARTRAALQRTAGGSVFAAYLSKASDRFGSAIHYRYNSVGGRPQISTIHYVSPESCAGDSSPEGAADSRRCRALLSEYGARVAFVYEDRPDVQHRWEGGVEEELLQRLVRIDLTAASGSTSGRALVRRYRLAYHAGHRSFLASIQLEGRPESTNSDFGYQVGKGVKEASLTDAVVGVLLPPMTFAYSQPPAAVDPDAYMGGLDLNPRYLETPPPLDVSVASADTDLFDVNADGLVDVIRTQGGSVETFFAGFEGPLGTPAGVSSRFSAAISMPVVGAPTALTLADDHWFPGDTDADARSELVFIPGVGETLGRARPHRTVPGEHLDIASQGLEWEFTASAMNTPAALDVGTDPSSYRYSDVDGDGLVDIVHITAAETNIWWNLGRFEGGEGRFGRALPGAIDPWTLQEQPDVHCAPRFLGPVLLSDANTRVGDFNGDGLVDLAYFADPGLALYYGRGNGDFGDPVGCGGANYDSYRPNALAGIGGNAIALSETRVADINGDGFADLVRAGADVRIRLGRVEESFDPMITDPAFGAGNSDAIRIADIDGNLAVDIVRGEDDWPFVTPGGDLQSGLLTTIDNGRGAVTTITYGTTVDEYLADRASGEWDWEASPLGCASCAALASSALNTVVVKSIETSDRFGELRTDEHGAPDSQVSRIEFAYHDGAYGGEDRSFWGFRVGDSCTVGDVTEPTRCTRTYFHQARRPEALAGSPRTPNPYQALQGQPYLTETWAESGPYTSTEHTTYALRTWFGEDGHPVQQALPVQTDRFTYPAVGYAPGTEEIDLPAVVAEGPTAAKGGVGTGAPAEPYYGDDQTHSVVLRGATFAHTRTRVQRQSNLGGVATQVRDGRLRDESDAGPTDYGELIATHTSLQIQNAAGQFVLVEAATEIRDASDAVVRRSTTRYDDLGFAIARQQDAAWNGTPFDFGALGTTPNETELVTGYARDSWGSQTEVCLGGEAGASCDRPSSLTYEPNFARFPVRFETETGATSLVSTASYDGGLGLATRTREANDVEQRATYDGAGRLVATRSPVPGCTTPSRTFHYDVAPDGLPITTITTRSYSSCAGTYAERRDYVDGRGRARATLQYDDEANQWAKSGVGLLNLRGESRRTYQTVAIGGNPTVSEAVALPSAPFEATERDALGRVTRTTDALGHTRENRYGALRTERWDVDDLTPGHVHEGTSSIARTDGHDREIERIVVRRVPGVPGDTFVRLITRYSAAGDVLSLTRLASSDAAAIPTGADAPTSAIPGQRVDRVFSRDSAGRLLAVHDPSLDAPGKPEALGVWRYLHNAYGDLVATRDPRGCGEDFYFDRSGRQLGELLVGCDEAVELPAPAAELPGYAIGLTTGGPAFVHTRRWYDEAPPWAAEGFAAPAARDGLLVAVETIANRELYDHDARARVTRRQVQLAGSTFSGTLANVASLNAIPDPEPLPATIYDTQHTFSMQLTYDHADRLVQRDLPANPDWAALGGMGAAPSIASHIDLDPRRGLPERTWVSIDGQEYDILRSANYNVHGHMESVEVGAPGTLTVAYDYDDLLRPTSLVATRTPSAVPSEERPLAAVGTVMALDYEFDASGRLTAVRDMRDPLEWPDGYQPRQQLIEHDSLGRVVSVDSTYAETTAGTFGYGDEITRDWRDDFAAQAAQDPMHPQPAPAIGTTPETRNTTMTYDFNWLATRVEWNDDHHAFFDRSVGTAVTGLDVGLRPSAVYLWSNLDPTTPADLGGFATIDYGESGNVTGITVHAQCTHVGANTCTDPGGADLSTRRTALESGCSCASEQHFRYVFGPRNELMGATRYDREGGDWAIASRQRDVHDETKARRLKIVEHYSGGSVETRSMQVVVPGVVERRGTDWDVVDGWVGSAASSTELHYVTAGARLVWGGQELAGSGPDPFHRLTYRVADALDTTGAVVDLVSQEVASVSTYYATGARETHRVHESPLPVEPLGFSGKEEDVEVGLMYFGERYLMTAFNQWSSPDPADIHAVAGGEALNPYEYVGGGVFSARDPDGLAPEETTRYRGIEAGLRRLDAIDELEDRTITAEDRERGFRLRIVHESSGVTVRDIQDLTMEGSLPQMNILYVHESGPDTLISVAETSTHRFFGAWEMNDLTSIDRSAGSFLAPAPAGEIRYRAAEEQNAFMADRLLSRGYTIGQARHEFRKYWKDIADLVVEGASGIITSSTGVATTSSLAHTRIRQSLYKSVNQSRSLVNMGDRQIPWWQFFRRMNATNRARLDKARETDRIPEGVQTRAFRREIQ
ncbi:MAG: SpvB/TcaC N-terminal domain-containing protein [Myxococcota bacterium]